MILHLIKNYSPHKNIAKFVLLQSFERKKDMFCEILILPHPLQCALLDQYILRRKFFFQNKINMKMARELFKDSSDLEFIIFNKNLLHHAHEQNRSRLM